MPLLAFYPEMKETKPDAKIEARLSHYGKHYFLDTPLELSGRGIIHLGTYTASQLRQGSYKIGWNQYKVTERAFDKLCEQHDVSYELML
jgi:hypothetical protein